MTESTTAPEISPDMTMERILALVPAAQRALFQRYHVGGCSKCGFELGDTLQKVCVDHNLLDVQDVIQTIQRAHEVDQRMLVEPADAARELAAGGLRLIDVRTQAEWDLVHIDGAELLDYSASESYMQLPKDTPLVFLCKTGDRAMDVASYFIGHGFTNVAAIRGGLDAWREKVDASLADYELEE